jgi:predicted CopG family antitoxin
LEAYRQVLTEKERLNCSVSDAIVRLIKEQEPTTAKVSR